MPWKEVSVLSARAEFLASARRPGATIRHRSERFGISRTTAYQWPARDRAGPPVGDSPRTPHPSPRRTPPAVADRVLALRSQYPARGGRKLRALLLRERAPQQPVPSASTITAILRRHGRLDGSRAGPPRDWQRFEHAAPNDLWQMDFEGHFPLGDGRRCHPLTVLDDPPRFAVGLVPCSDERTETVPKALRALFTRSGLPARILMDDGPPRGDPGGQLDTRLAVRLLERGIRSSHGRPYHPQTRGKDERFHRTLNQELLRRTTFADPADCAARFEERRTTYNAVRPHDALDLPPPARRYRFSPTPFVEPPPPLAYDPALALGRVQVGGGRWYRGVRYWVPTAVAHRRLGLHRPGPADPIAVWFGPHRLGEIDPTTGKLVRKRASEAG